jgi:hypothetical protein
VLDNNFFSLELTLRRAPRHAFAATPKGARVFKQAKAKHNEAKVILKPY